MTATTALRDFFYQNVNDYRTLNSPLFLDLAVRLIDLGADVNIPILGREGDVSVHPLEVMISAYYTLQERELPNSNTHELIYYLLEKGAVVTDGAVEWVSLYGDTRMMEDLLKRTESLGLITVHDEEMLEVTQGFEHVAAIKDDL